MESTSTADLLDASLELLDDVEGFDLFFSDVNSAVEPAYTTRDAALDQDSALMQQLELNGDLDPNLSKLIHTPSSSVGSEQDANTAVPIANPLLEGVNKQQKSTRKLRHQRKKNELEYLRNQVTELEKELESLKDPSKIETGDQVAACPSGGDVSVLWERVATNQRRERVKAEVENAKLRERLEGQLKMAKSLEKLLRKRPAEESESGGCVKMRTQKMAGLQESEVFALLASKVDTLYERVDGVMKEVGLGVVRREHNEAQVKRDRSGRVCVELVDAKILPFAVQDVAKAVWKTLTSKRIELDNGYYKVRTFVLLLRC